MKRKIDIGLLTLHKINNFGSILQCFALYKYLEKIGYSVIVVDFVPNRLKIKNLSKKTNKKFPLNILVFIIKYIRYSISLHRINKFLRENLILTNTTYFNSSDLRNNLPDVKAFLAGSDQIWNSLHNKCIEASFFLDFVPDEVVKASYAASFGKDKLDEWEKEETLKLLKKIDSISVREKSSISILKELGIPNAIQNIDPIFLLNKEEWSSFMKRKKNVSNYVVIYEVNNENLDKLYNVASKIAVIKNCEIHIIKTTQRKKNLKGYSKVHEGLSPFEFLEVILNAEYVVTGSFHGTAFSINFNKQFFVVLPNNFSTRLYNILEIFGLLNHIVCENTIEEVLNSSINYDRVNNIIDVEKMKSKEYLLGLL